MKHLIDKVWIDDQFVYVSTKDGLEASTPFKKWKRLANASQSDRQAFVLSPSGIHWPTLDEDLSFGGIFYEAGLCEWESCEEDFVCFSSLSCNGRN